MSVEIPKAFVQSYSSDSQHLGQQRGSVLQGAVDVVTGLTGTRHNFEQVGVLKAQKRTTRHGDTPLSNADHPRRIIDMDFYEIGQLFDPQDDPKILTDPRGKYQEAAQMAMGREKDEIILAAANGTSTIGGANGVTSATGTEAFTNTFTAGTSTSLTVPDLITAKRLITAAKVAMPGERLYCACSAHSIADLLGQSATQSIDTNTVRALAEGDIMSFMGFTFLSTELVGGLATANEKVYFWHEKGIKLGIGRDITSRIAEDPGKSFSTVIYNGMYLAATRMQASSVVTTDIDHS